jgi:Tol biopolymer transport system component
MKPKLWRLTLLPLLFLLTASVCNPSIQTEKDIVEEEEAEDISTSESNNKWSGKLVTEYSGDIRYYTFKTKQETVVYKDAKQPFVTADGDVLIVSGKFPKANYLVQLADPEFNNAKSLLDFSDGWFGGYMYGVKLSPDGQYIAAGITSYGDYKIKNDAVVIFDLERKIVAQFNQKYQPDWTPDGRVVMAGSLLSESVDGKVYTKEAGIFISNKDFTSVKRIDPGFDEPAPANVAVSPNGEKVAFIKNTHVWVMDLDGSNARPITASGGDNAESFPTWSPDGKYIACWVYKTFEKSYYTAIAVVPSTTKEPIKLSNTAPVWPRDKKGFRVSGGAHQFSWVKK